MIKNYSLDLEAYALAFEESLSDSALDELLLLKDYVVAEFDCVSAVSLDNFISKFLTKVSTA